MISGAEENCQEICIDQIVQAILPFQIDKFNASSTTLEALASNMTETVFGSRIIIYQDFHRAKDLSNVEPFIKAIPAGTWVLFTSPITKDPKTKERFIPTNTKISQVDCSDLDDEQAIKFLSSLGFEEEASFWVCATQKDAVFFAKDAYKLLRYFPKPWSQSTIQQLYPDNSFTSHFFKPFMLPPCLDSISFLHSLQRRLEQIISLRSLGGGYLSPKELSSKSNVPIFLALKLKPLAMQRNMADWLKMYELTCVAEHYAYMGNDEVQEFIISQFV
ncbi:hypothetical protein UFOVP967_85 [uncultured Caudovirales phage]|uniref:Uncharacterized protein n=1 Tax=uncultured Caudovirales phage TaxID=2100421 RepID=A0A6J5SYW4_9CAUD|nr:hypothetical protein UFOVP521_31 [uncultured Caudovirales phage]CAB4167082.1 hypothetical protein UFOVP856_3 [uncultured Caudovirales phage]CAB4174814.1 hypothetical protein UFOVP967_85 [uncultured Caudovirales phage]CAB4180731.1 hypothetical protein UFOVP1036_97 [uncultured Caudovirales phage]CAB4186296.1 hypothetical protein UFOVP1132_71 [uncultured Caudovirales phage]